MKNREKIVEKFGLRNKNRENLNTLKNYKIPTTIVSWYKKNKNVVTEGKNCLKRLLLHKKNLIYVKITSRKNSVGKLFIEKQN